MLFEELLAQPVAPLSPATGISLNAGAVGRDVSLKAVPGVRGRWWLSSHTSAYKP